MNKSETKQKELYETPSVLDIKPVSVLHGDETTSGIEAPEENTGYA